MATKAWRASYQRIMPTKGRNEEHEREPEQEPQPEIEPPKSAMENLPNELLNLILDLVSLPRKNYYGHPDQACLGTRDLLSVIHSSHRLRLVGQPILWRRVVQTRSLTLPSLIRVALLRPELASQVLKIELNDSHRATASEAQLRQHLDEAGIAAVHSFLGSSELGTTNFECDQWASLAAFALSLTSNVETLDINIQQGDCPVRFAPLKYAFSGKIQLVEEPVPFLPKLRKLSISFEKRSQCPNLQFQFLLPYLQHASLETFIGYKIGGAAQLWPEGMGKLILGLKSICFESSNIPTSGLVDLVQSCPALESFMYDHDQGIREEELIPSVLGTALAQLKPTLKELTLFRRERLHQTFYSVTVAGLSLIGSLSGFKALTSLSITAHLLLGYQYSLGSAWSKRFEAIAHDVSQKLAQVLPPSLQYLRLMNCGAGMLQGVMELVEQKEWVVPKLETIVLEFQDLMNNKYEGGFVDKTVRRTTTHTMVNEKLLVRLEELCRNKGIVLDIWYN